MNLRNTLSEGPRIFYQAWKNRVAAKRYGGNAEQICRQIIEDCWNGRFFMTSTANFPQFWTRDFGLCVQSLLNLDFQKEVVQTLRYAINRFTKDKTITTTITTNGRPFDFPTKSVDSLPWFIHSIKISKFSYHNYKEFLNRQITQFYRDFIDPETGLVKSDLHVSSIKDWSIRKSSCYDNCMVAMLAQDLKDMKLLNPFKKHNYSEIIKENFWNGKYFYDDITKQEYVAGDANIFPFLSGAIKDKKMLESALKEIQESGLDQPFPLSYTNSKKNIKFIWESIFMPNYEGTAIWMNMGPFYIKLVQQVNPKLAHEYTQNYTALIEKHKNYYEVFTEKGKPYTSPFYYSSPGMLWCANYLTL